MIDYQEILTKEDIFKGLSLFLKNAFENLSDFFKNAFEDLSEITEDALKCLLSMLTGLLGLFEGILDNKRPINENFDITHPNVLNDYLVIVILPENHIKIGYTTSKIKKSFYVFVEFNLNNINTESFWYKQKIRLFEGENTEWTKTEKDNVLFLKRPANEIRDLKRLLSTTLKYFGTWESKTKIVRPGLKIWVKKMIYKYSLD